MAQTKLATAKIANAVLDPIPWYRSKVVIGGLVALLVMVANYFGLLTSITGADQETLTDLIVLAVGGGGSLTAIISRIRQKAAPQIKAL